MRGLYLLQSVNYASLSFKQLFKAHSIASAILTASGKTNPRRTEYKLSELPAATVAVTLTSPTLGRDLPQARPGRRLPRFTQMLPSSSSSPTQESTAITLRPEYRRLTEVMASDKFRAVTGADSVPTISQLILRAAKRCPTSGPIQSPVTRSEPMQSTTGGLRSVPSAECKSKAVRDTVNSAGIVFMDKIVDSNG